MITREEITNIVYDTLMQNKQHLQLDVDKIDDQEVDSRDGLITFTYGDVWIGMVVIIREGLP